MSPLTLVALTLSEDTGLTGNDLLARARNEIRALESEGRIPGLQATLGEDSTARPSPASPRNSPGEMTPRAKCVLQAELSFCD